MGCITLPSRSSDPCNACVAIHDFALPAKDHWILSDFFICSCESGSGCSTAVERTLRERKVVSSIPVGCWAFFLFLFVSSA